MEIQKGEGHGVGGQRLPVIPQPEASVIPEAGEDSVPEAEDMGVRAESGTGGVLRPEPGQQQVPVKE